MKVAGEFFRTLRGVESAAGTTKWNRRRLRSAQGMGRLMEEFPLGVVADVEQRFAQLRESLEEVTLCYESKHLGGIQRGITFREQKPRKFLALPLSAEKVLQQMHHDIARMAAWIREQHERERATP